MSADALLSRLDKVKRTGDGRWMACCPAHEDRHASLSIRELDDGRLLLHCFGQQCGVDAITRALGLEITDLFPPRSPTADRTPKARRPFLMRDAILALHRELTVAWLILSDVAAGKSLTDFDRKRAAIARDRCVALLSELTDLG